MPAPEDEGPQSPEIPSFESLRDPRRRSALDLLVPGAPSASPPPSPAEELRPAGPRPAQWPDLGRFAVRVLRWAATTPVRCLIRR